MTDKKIREITRDEAVQIARARHKTSVGDDLVKSQVLDIQGTCYKITFRNGTSCIVPRMFPVADESDVEDKTPLATRVQTPEVAKHGIMSTEELVVSEHGRVVDLGLGLNCVMVIESDDDVEPGRTMTCDVHPDVPMRVRRIVPFRGENFGILQVQLANSEIAIAGWGTNRVCSGVPSKILSAISWDPGHPITPGGRLRMTVVNHGPSTQSFAAAVLGETIPDSCYGKVILGLDGGL